MTAERDTRRRRKLRRGIYLLPSAFTVGNLFAGFFSLIATLNGDYDAAAIAIGIAVFLDAVDGRVARMANASSDFGLQLDSLADIISFGVAPAVLIYSWGLADLGNFARFSAFFFLVCGSVRLARFNIQVQDLKNFAGLPIPGGAALVAASVHYFQSPAAATILGWPVDARFFQFGLSVMIYGLALLMISTIRYPSLKRLNPSRQKSHLTIPLMALLIAGVFLYSDYVLMAMACTYVASGLVSRVYQVYRMRGRRDEESIKV